MFGIEEINRSAILPLVDGEEDEMIYCNVGHHDFIETISSDGYEPIRDEVSRQLEIQRIHSVVYGLNAADSFGDEGKPARTYHESLEPVIMRREYQIHSKTSWLYQIAQEHVMYDVYKYTGLTLGDWMNLTLTEIKVLKDVLEERKKLEAKVQSEVEKSLEEAK